MTERELLQSLLEKVYDKYHRSEYLYADPLEFVRRYPDPRDQEAAGLVAALVAYGNVKQIRRSVENALERMNGEPARFVDGLAKKGGLEKARRALEGFVHRFNNGADILLLMRLLGRSWQERGSMGHYFESFLKESDRHIGTALDGFVGLWKEWALKEEQGPYFNFLLNSPSDGSCCKRWCMFLRWMVRDDGLDLGLWKGIRTDQLILPLDTHTGRISRELGLTKRKNSNWQSALEITESLKRFDPRDPTRYDFALTRLGMLELSSNPKERMKQLRNYLSS